ncbi:MAG: hypothetical protein WCF59_00275 [Desulfobaccales bacterium]|jgi:hypothetical protein
MTINGHYQLFDYLDSRDRNVMQGWASDFDEEQRGRLDLRIEVLERAKVGEDLPPKLLTPTSGKPRQRHILEMPMKGQVALRPMLCRGPIDMGGEFTFLDGAVERDRKYVPLDAPRRAEANRQDLIERGEIGRENHKRFNIQGERSF